MILIKFDFVLNEIFSVIFISCYTQIIVYNSILNIYITPLHLAVLKNNIEIVNLLLNSAEIKIELKDEIFFIIVTKFFPYISWLSTIFMENT